MTCEKHNCSYTAPSCPLCNGEDPQPPTESWEKEFDKKFNWGIVSLINSDKEHPKSIRDLKEVKAFIRTLLSESETKHRAEMEKAVKAENKEWREGRRCEICGKEQSPSALSNMCGECFKNG